jgi:hypothetical protein
MLTGRENVVIRVRSAKGLSPLKEFYDYLHCVRVQRSYTFSSFGFAPRNRQSSVHQVNVSPAQILEFTAPHGGIQCENSGTRASQSTGRVKVTAVAPSS